MARYRVVWLTTENELLPKHIEDTLNKYAGEGYRLAQTFVIEDHHASHFYRYTLYLVFEKQEDLKVSVGPSMVYEMNYEMNRVETGAGDGLPLREMREAERQVEPGVDPLLDGLRR